MSSEQIEGFKRLTSPFLPDWTSMELRLIAERGRDGQLVLNVTTVRRLGMRQT